MKEERVIADRRTRTEFGPEELVSLIVGPSFPNQEVERLRKLVRKHPTPIKILRPTVSRSEYSIEVDWEASL